MQTQKQNHGDDPKNSASAPSVEYLVANQPTVSIFFVILPQIALLIFLLLSLIFGVLELTIFCFVLLTVGLSTYVWALFSPHRVSCTLTADKTRMFPSDRCHLQIDTVNRKILPALIKIMFPMGGNLCGAGTDEVYAEQIGLLWYQRTTFSKEFSPAKRGVYAIGPPTLHISDLFGFFPRNKMGTGAIEIIVYPRTIPMVAPPIPKREFFGIPGANNPVEDPVYVIGTREYQPGRPARHINWKASARHDKLQEKICEPAEQEKILLCVDMAGFEKAHAWDDFEHTLEKAASLALHLESKRMAIGFITNAKIIGTASRIIPISRAPEKVATILELMARMQVRSDEPLQEILANRYELPWGVSTLLFGYKAAESLRTLAYFNTRNVPVYGVYAVMEQPANNENALWEKAASAQGLSI